ncbi:uncharacterized protein LOC133199698 [Saccostrea echinata]|uniref:uncharacterized protein LOC133199698 n=1 Tax=Saccostrea echinata TaxID=191078 RepID=UPI002A81B22D|nr:uncharacterized protein LOC133199698 [Saccostrea echinata]
MADRNRPDDWKVGLILKLPKKCDLADTNNWRGIILLSVTSKVLSRVTLNRMASLVDPYLRKEQAGFRKGKSDQIPIFALRQILEQEYALQGLKSKGDMGHRTHRQLSNPNGVRQGCLLSPLLCTFCIDCLMKITTSQANRGISWTFQQSLEDLDIADDIALLA